MEINLRLSLDHMTSLVTLLSDYGAGIPQQKDNLARLKTWRTLLEQCSVEQRAELAAHEPFWNAALKMIPGLSTVPDRPRSLDWDRLENPQQSGHAELLAEEQAWKEAGLIANQTWSSSEWPAAALAHACLVTQRPMPRLPEILWNQADRNRPGVLEALLPLAAVEELDWEAFFSLQDAGRRGLRADLASQDSPVGRALLSVLPPAMVADLGKEQGGVFHQRAMDPIEVKEWVQRGANPSAQDKEGRYAEETFPYLTPQYVLAYHQALAPYRSPEVNKNILARTCLGLLVSHSREACDAAGVIKALLWEPTGLSFDPAQHVLKEAGRGYKKSIASYDDSLKSWFNIEHEARTQSPEGMQWLTLFGSLGAIHGIGLGMGLVMEDNFRGRWLEKYKNLSVTEGENALLTGLEGMPKFHVSQGDVLNYSGAHQWLAKPVTDPARWGHVLELGQKDFSYWFQKDLRRRSLLEDEGAPTGYLQLLDRLLTVSPEMESNEHAFPLFLMASFVASELKKNPNHDTPALLALEGLHERLESLPKAQAFLRSNPERVADWVSHFRPDLHRLVRAQGLDDGLPSPTVPSSKPRF